ICWYLLRLGNLARAVAGVRLHRVSFAVLFATLPVAALIPVATNATAFYRIELIVTIPHFLLILYVFLVDWKWAWAAYRKVLESRDDLTVQGKRGNGSLRDAEQAVPF